MREFKTTVWPEAAIRLQASFEDFKGTLLEWKEAWYFLWRLEMTFGFAHELKLREGRERGVYVDMLIKPAYKDNVQAHMKDLGYENIQSRNERVGKVDMCEVPLDMDVIEVDG